MQRNRILTLRLNEIEYTELLEIQKKYNSGNIPFPELTISQTLRIIIKDHYRTINEQND